ncbi:MAG: hypothetical protein AAYR33_06410 [Acetobacteraceae bacterium]
MHDINIVTPDHLGKSMFLRSITQGIGLADFLNIMLLKFPAICGSETTYRTASQPVEKFDLTSERGT